MGVNEKLKWFRKDTADQIADIWKMDRRGKTGGFQNHALEDDRAGQASSGMERHGRAKYS